MNTLLPGHTDIRSAACALLAELSLEDLVIMCDQIEKKGGRISQTLIKNCFKGVYGIPLYTYIREQKMQAAALLLCKSDCTILEIAERCGYDNGSKFAASFRTVIGMTPGEYRTMKRQEDKIYDDQ